jgi:hypothetical protein
MMWTMYLEGTRLIALTVAVVTLMTVVESVQGDTAVCPSLQVTNSSMLCGAEFWLACPTGSCCSNKGACSPANVSASEVDDFCDQGCQRGFSKCWGSGYGSVNCAGALAGPGVSESPCPNITLGTDLRCGEAFGERCPSGSCCSAKGSCSPLSLNTANPSQGGSTDAKFWCDVGCQRQYGRCWGSVDNSTIVCPPPQAEGDKQRTTGPCLNLAVSKDLRCGPEFNSTRCPGTEICCSGRGSCQDDGGTSGEAWCGTGCQRGYGKCFGIAVIDCNSLGQPPSPKPSSATRVGQITISLFLFIAW